MKRIRHPIGSTGPIAWVLNFRSTRPNSSHPPRSYVLISFLRRWVPRGVTGPDNGLLGSAI